MTAVRRLTISVPILDAVRVIEATTLALFCLVAVATVGPNGEATLTWPGAHAVLAGALAGVLAVVAWSSARRCERRLPLLVGGAGALLAVQTVLDAQGALPAGVEVAIDVVVVAVPLACAASWWRGVRGRFGAAATLAGLALAAAVVLLLASSAWQLQWWAAHAGLLCAAGVLLAGSTRERALRGELSGGAELIGLASMAQQIVDEMSDALAVFDDSGTIVGWNRAATSVTGWSRDEAQQQVPPSTPEGLVPLGAGRWVRTHGFDLARGGRCFRALLFRDATEEVRTLKDREELEQRVRERTAEVERTQLDILERLAQAAELRDDETGQHTRRVGRLAGLIAAELGLPGSECDLIRRAAPLHDLGKIGVPDTLLQKPGSLTDDEFEQIKLHTEIGGRLLDSPGFELGVMAREIALTHHERWDGNGYPRGLRGEEIPLCGRIVAVADIFDALTHERPYKHAWPVEDAVAEIARQSGAQLDRECVAAFLRVVARGGIDERTTHEPSLARFTRA